MVKTNVGLTYPFDVDIIGVATAVDLALDGLRVVHAVRVVSILVGGANLLGPASHANFIERTYTAMNPEVACATAAKKMLGL